MSSSILFLFLVILGCVHCVSRSLRANLYTEACGGASYFGSVVANFGTCYPNKIFNAPNCSEYTRCAAGNPTIQQFADCLPQESLFYVIPSYFNNTAYQVNLYTDTACTIPLSDPSVVYVPMFGCMDAFYSNMTDDCGFKTNIYPFNVAATLAPFWADLF